MAKTLPTSYTAPTVANTTRGEIILAGDIQSVVHNQHYFHARAGNRLGGVIFDPDWQTTSLSYTTTNSNVSGGRDLDTFAATGLVLRPTGNATGNARVAMYIYGADFDVRCTIKRLDTGATVTTLTVTKDETFAWESGTVAISYSTYSAIPLEFTFDARFNNADVLCQVFQIDIHSEVYTSTAYLPIT